MTNPSLATYLTLVMQEASSVRSEMETSSLVGVEQAFFLPLLVFSGVVFSAEALVGHQVNKRRGILWLT